MGSNSAVEKWKEAEGSVDAAEGLAGGGKGLDLALVGVVGGGREGKGRVISL
jgi:hypothetical protein